MDRPYNRGTPIVHLAEKSKGTAATTNHS